MGHLFIIDNKQVYIKEIEEHVNKTVNNNR